jgi:prepilin-type processing-associated H-X9-DG protein
MNILNTLVCCIALAVPASEKEERTKTIPPFLDDRTVAVGHLDLSRLDVDAVMARVRVVGKVEGRDLAEFTKQARAFHKKLLDAGARDVYAFVSLIDIPLDPPFVVIPLEKGADAKALMVYLKGMDGLSFEKRGDFLVGASATIHRRLKTLKPLARPEVTRAFAGAGAGVARLVLVLTVDTPRILEDVMPTLPKELGGGSIKPLSRGLKWAALRVDAPPKFAVHAIIQTADHATATALHDLLGRLGKVIGSLKEVRDQVPTIDKLLAVMKFKVEKDRLTLTLDEKTLVESLRPIILDVVEEKRQARAGANLRKILTAIHNYHDAHSRFPAEASYDKAGKPLLSWRVHLLPHLGEGKLYKEFHLDEPWDSPHNKKLIARMPAVFRSSNPKLAAQFKTNYLAPIHEETMFPGRRGVRLADVTDGTANTIILVDVEDALAVVWTKPEDLTYDPKNPHKGLAVRHGGKIMTAFADGSVHFLPKTMDRMHLHFLFTRAGGEVVKVP